MKRVFLPLFASLIGISAFAQSEITALDISRNNLTGTARSVAMGGAFGALGGDISGVAINPAGIGIYRSSEVVGTFNFQNNKTQTTLNASTIDESKFQFDFDNFGLVGVFPTNDDVVPRINFGFSYNKLKSFDRKYHMYAKGVPSITHFMADQANVSERDGYPVSANNWDGNWLGIFGLDGGLITEDNGIYRSTLKGDVNNGLNVREKGSVNSYDFNAGTSIADIFSIGATVSVTDIDYRLYSTHSEFVPADDFILINNQKIEGTGYQLKVGSIIKPIDEIRIGVAYHSPTWYEMSSYKWGELYSTKNPKSSKWVTTPNDLAREDFDFKTPDKWVFSLAGVIAKRWIISADYELTNYKSGMRFKNADKGSYFYNQNSYIGQDFRNASTLRVGTEVRFTPQLSGRVGFAWAESPYNNSLKGDGNSIDISPRETAPQYTVQGDTYHYTWGAGYKFTESFYADIAFVIKTQTDDLYAFPKRYAKNGNGEVFLLVDSKKAELKNNIFSGLITLGYKF